jgi:DNA-binding NarL/FixJ family response regulator
MDKSLPDTPIVLIHMEDAPEYRRAAIAAGARAFVAKREIATRLVPLVKTLVLPESGIEPGKGVMQETYKMPVERTDDFVGFTIAENMPHLNQPN